MSSAEARRMCICSWPECREWSAFLATNLEHSSLGNLVRFKYSNITELRKSLLTETNMAKAHSIQANLSAQLRFRKLILHHLKPPQAKVLEGRDITIARYHFPHHYIRSRQRSLHRPVSHHIAKSYGVGVLPNDRINLASLEENTYHVPPIVTRSHMKMFIQGLKPSSGTDQQCTNSSRSSRMIRRANIAGSTPSLLNQSNSETLNDCSDTVEDSNDFENNECGDNAAAQVTPSAACNSTNNQ